MNEDWHYALKLLKAQITYMPRAPHGDCVCCRNHAVDIHLLWTAENFNRIRESLFSLPDNNRTPGEEK